MKEETKNDVIALNTNELSTTVNSMQNGLTTYLGALGLPNSNVLVDTQERSRVIANLPEVLRVLPETVRKESLYISKFVAACGVGLFDAALNFVWDETVSSLRQKVIKFDLEYFYNSVITDPDRRHKFNTEEDINKLDDWELVRGCVLTGILSDIGFRHLDYIRDMRNWASAAHPNQSQLTGFQLVSWLETCIREVIAREPSTPAIAIQRLLKNMRTHPLGDADIPPIAENISLLPDDLVTSLLRTLFGIYCDPSIAVFVKDNIRLLAPATWKRAAEYAKREMGIKYATYAANADIPKRDSAKNFLDTVDGLSYLPKDTLTVEINGAIQSLQLAHLGFNNFYNEPPHAKALAKYIPANGTVPEEVRYIYVKTVSMCYIGNGYGISGVAYPYYEELVSKYQDLEMLKLVSLLADEDFSSRMQFQSCRERFRGLLGKVRAKTSNDKIIRAMDYILKLNDKQLPTHGKATEYKRIVGLA